MNYAWRWEVNEGIMIFAFGYMLQGRYSVAIYFAILALCLAIYWHSLKSLLRFMGLAGIILFMQGMILLNAPLPTSFLSLSILLCCNTLVSTAWLTSSRKVMQNGLRLSAICFGILLAITFLAPVEILPALWARAQVVILLVIMGIPLVGTWVYRILLHRLSAISHRMRHTPV